MSSQTPQQGPTKKQEDKQKQTLSIVAVVALFVLFGCGSITLTVVRSVVNALFDDTATSEAIETAPTWDVDSAALTIAVSPVMAPVLEDIAQRFNSQNQQTPDERTMSAEVIAITPDQMVRQSVDGTATFQAISPDSSLWLEDIEQRWATQQANRSTDGVEPSGDGSQVPLGQARTSNRVRYAISPIVIAAWEDVARALGWPANPVGWQDIQELATRDENFKWNHASTNTASGLLATLAEFYAGANLTRGLTEEAATAPETLAYVQAVESTVRFYGEGEEVITRRLATEGRNFLDAFVVQERIVIDWNRTRAGERLVAIYPAEGTLWADHPLALLELGGREDEPAITDNQRLTYQAFADYLTSTPVQEKLLHEGYRPADLNIALDAAGSPFAETGANAGAVDWRQPQTTLQMPPPAVIDVVRNAWYFTKRPTNVYLVVDTSGSMEGPTLDRTKAALKAFVEQIQGNRDRVGIVEFGSGTKRFIPLRVLDDSSRTDTLLQIDYMEAYGGTALLDAVYESLVDLLAQQDREAINAVVVMTDGQENESLHGLTDLQDLVRSQPSAQLVIFTIAFGSDADEAMLRDIATIGNGQFRRADETDIEELYRIISTYF